MGFDTEKSFIMAERLKQLREEKGLSHEKLSKALSDQYGVKISSDSLINYEVADKNHTKAYKNQGMRVEYLRCLADFYGISTDYLLGISDVKSRDPDVRMITQSIGISEECVLRLQHTANLMNGKIFTTQAMREIEKAKSDATRFKNYLLKEFNQNPSFMQSFSDRYGTSDMQKLAELDAHDSFTEAYEMIIAEMKLSECLPLEALNTLIRSEIGYQILTNIALFLLAEPEEGKISFCGVTSDERHGAAFEVDSNFLIAGLLSSVDNGLQELRKTTTKKIMLCGTESFPVDKE